MFENIGLVAAKAVEKEPTTLETVVMGIGTVFVGLVAIVIICKIVGLLCGAAKKPKEETVVQNTVNAPIENKGEIVAAVCAVVAEELGTDVSAIRVHSFKKL